MADDATPERSQDFIRTNIDADRATGRFKGRVQTRFPPEPNGYLHLGHTKAICVDYGIADEYGGVCFLRLDDTNPETESPEYAESIKRDVEWLGFEVGDRVRYASDYFDQLYEMAVEMVRQGRAYVDSSTLEEMREARGTAFEAGRPTPYRSRSIEENLDLLERMRSGEFDDGAHVLRFKGDLSASNMKLRDPLMYRIRKAHHYRTGDRWCLYPMYDWAHGLSDAIEGVTHSICTLEFQDNRALYDLFVEAVGFEEPPYQMEMARLALTYIHLSKRKLIALVDEGHVDGWDDPRMPTIAGLRRRGVRPEAIVGFVKQAGIAKTNSTIDYERLEQAIRDDLNPRVPRVMAVLDPIPLVLENWPAEEVDTLDASLYPHDVPLTGSRPVPFTRTVLIDRSDFAEEAPKGWRRLTLGGEVRLRYAYVVRCTGVERDQNGRITALKGTVDRDSRGGRTADGRKIKGTIQWVSAAHGTSAEVRLYDRLYRVPHPGQAEDWRTELNPESLIRKTTAVIEPFIADDDAGSRYQFERLGYFFRDPIDGVTRPVFNRIVGLRDSWTRTAAKPPSPKPPKKPKQNKSVKRDQPQAEVSPEAQALMAAHPMSTADANVLTRTPPLRELFDAVIAAGGDSRGVAALIVNDLGSALAGAPLDTSRATPAAIAELAALQQAGTINSKVARDVLATLVAEGGSAKSIVEEKGLTAITDPAELERIVAAVFERHPAELAAYRDGKTKLAGYFIGQVMRESGGRADPRALKALLMTRLKG